MRKQSVRFLVAALVSAWVGVLLTAGDSPAQLYRYVDKNGNVVFTDNPPPGARVEAVDKGEPIAEHSPSREGAKAADEAKGSPSQTKPGKDPSTPSEKAREAEMKRIADEEIQKEKDAIQRKQQEKQQEKQSRLEEADRLEQEAKKPIVPTQENIDRQRKLMEEAERLRQMP